MKFPRYLPITLLVALAACSGGDPGNDRIVLGFS